MIDLDAAIRQNGFNNLEEFNDLICEVNMSTPEKLSAYKEWQYRDGTKEGLLKLIAQQINATDLPDKAPSNR